MSNIKQNYNHRKITLEQDLIDECKIWCHKASALHNNFTGSYMGSQNASRQHIFAAFWAAKIAEVGAAIILDVEPSFKLNKKKFSDGGVDFKVKMNHKSYTVDVKSTTVKRGEYLVWPRYKPLDSVPDILVFARTGLEGSENFGEVFVPSFIMGKQFVRMCRKAGDSSHLHKGTPYLHYRDMTPIEILQSATRTCFHCGKPASFGVGKINSCGDHRGAAELQV